MARIEGDHKSTAHQTEPKVAMNKPGFIAMEGANRVAPDLILDTNEQTDTLLRQLSKQETTIREPFKPGKKREVVHLQSDPHVDKAAIPVIKNRKFTEPLGDAIGSHRAPQKKRPT